MKKLLGILVLGLLLSSNAYAASKFTYLSCKNIIFDNRSKGEYKDSELYKIGKYIGHSFIKFKNVKKKWTRITVYSQGLTTPPTDPENWMNYAPKLLLEKEKFHYSGGDYFYKFGYEGFEIIWLIGETKNNHFYSLYQIKYDETGIDITSTSHDKSNQQSCKNVDKKEFNELIKKGIK